MGQDGIRGAIWYVYIERLFSFLYIKTTLFLGVFSRSLERKFGLVREVFCSDIVTFLYAILIKAAN